MCLYIGKQEAKLSLG